MDLAWTCLAIEDAADAFPYAEVGQLGAVELSEAVFALAEGYVTEACRAACTVELAPCEGACVGPGGESVTLSLYVGERDSTDTGGVTTRTTVVVYPPSGDWSRLTVIREVGTYWDANQGSDGEDTEWYVNALGTLDGDLPLDPTWQASRGTTAYFSPPELYAFESWEDDACTWRASYRVDVASAPTSERWGVTVDSATVIVTAEDGICDGQRYASVAAGDPYAVDATWNAVADPCATLDPGDPGPVDAATSPCGCAVSPGHGSFAVLGLLVLARRRASPLHTSCTVPPWNRREPLPIPEVQGTRSNSHVATSLPRLRSRHLSLQRRRVRRGDWR